MSTEGDVTELRKAYALVCSRLCPDTMRGPAGPQGEQGAIGPTGPYGGPPGPTGSPGTNGIDGTTGPTGPQGIIGIRGPVGPEGPTGSTVYSDDTTLILDYQTTIPEGNLTPINFNAAYPGGMLDTWANLQSRFSWFEFMFYTDYYQYNTLVVRSTDLQPATGFTAFEISKVVGYIYFWIPVASGLSSKIAVYQPEGSDIVRLKIWGFGTGQGPQGDPGPTGPTGVGVTGPQGEAGPAGGPTGDLGPTGPTGNQGIQGPTGLQGSQGIQGPTGSTGIQGTNGSTGPTGNQGLTGSQGPQGIQGFTGPTGPQGIQGPTGISAQGTNIVASYYLKGDLAIPTGTGTAFIYDSTVVERGITLVDGSKITVSRTGIYEMYYSVQLVKTQGGTNTYFYAWLRVNGIDVPDTNGRVAINSNNADTLPIVQYVIQLNAGDYVEFIAIATESDVILDGVTGTPGPDIPSIIVGIKEVAVDIGATGVTGPTGYQGPTGPTGLQGENGVNGISSGTVLYLDGPTTSQTVPFTAPNNNMLVIPNVGTQTTITTNSISTSPITVANFVTEIGSLLTTIINPGLWTLNLFAQRTSGGGGNLLYWIDINEVDADGTTVLGSIATGSQINGTVIDTVAGVFTYSTFVQLYTLQSLTSRIQLVIKAISTAGSIGFNMKMRDNTLSNLITTIATNLVGQTGAQGPTGPAGGLIVVGSGTGSVLLNNPEGSTSAYYNSALKVLNDGTNDYLSIGGDLMPSASLTYSIGSTGTRWKDMFVGPGTINIAGPTGSAVSGTIGTDAQGIIYTESGLATPYVNIGPSQLVPLASGGWRIGPTGVQGSADYDLIAQENSVSGSGPTGPIYSLIRRQGDPGPTGPPGDAVPSPQGNTLTVDAVYGNDTTAALDPYRQPFLTIQAALNAASVGQNVRVRAGIYNESLIIPDNVSLTGDGAQAVVIQKQNVTSNTTLITMGANCRVENFTALLSSSGDYDLIGADFPSGTSITGKLRNSIWTITSTATGNPTIIGVRSAGTSSTAYSTPNAIQRSTINVISSSQGITRGILVSGANRFSVRDIVVYARGTGADITGVETTHASAVFEGKTSTFGGNTTGPTGASGHDINRSAGTLLIGNTDLLNNDSNGNSFSVTQAPASFQFGIINSLASNQRYYLIQGTSIAANLISEPKTDPFAPAKSFPILISEASVIIEINITYTETLATGQSVTFYIYKNKTAPPVMSLTLNAGETTKVLNTQSVSFAQNDTLEATLEVTGNPTGSYPAFSAIVYYY